MERSKIFKVYFIYFISMALFCILRILVAYNLLNFLNPNIVDIVFSLLVQGGIMFLIPFTLCLIFNKKKQSTKSLFKDMNFNKISGKVVFISIILGLIAFAINLIVGSVFNGLISFFGYSAPVGGATEEINTMPVWLTFIIQVITVAILPAICEEFLHRGILLNGIFNIGAKKAIVISSLLFALIHFNINQFFYAFIVGMVMALIVVVTKSIYPSMIIHFMNNFISIYLTYAEAYGWFGKNFYNYLNNFLGSSNIFLTFLTSFLFIGLILGLLLWLIMKLFKITTLNKVQNIINDVFKADIKEEQNEALKLEKSKIMQNMLENNSTINFEFENMSSPLDVVLPKQKDIIKMNIKDNMFLISSIVLGVMITLFTFVWGII